MSVAAGRDPRPHRPERLRANPRSSKILTGYHSPDAGATLTVDGQRLGPARPLERGRRPPGSRSCTRTSACSTTLTVAENIGIGGFVHHHRSRKIDWKAQDAIARRGPRPARRPRRHPAPRWARCTPCDRAAVAIARALRDQRPGEGLVILDEATRALPREELDRFHALLRRVVADGTSVLMVSHNLEEVLALSRPGHRPARRRGGGCRAARPQTSPSTTSRGRCSARPWGRWSAGSGPRATDAVAAAGRRAAHRRPRRPLASRSAPARSSASPACRAPASRRSRSSSRAPPPARPATVTTRNGTRSTCAACRRRDVHGPRRGARPGEAGSSTGSPSS